MNKIATTINQLFEIRGIKAQVVKIQEGLRTCKYFVELDISEKVSRIKALEEDLTLRVKSVTPPSIFIEAGHVVIETTMTDAPISVPIEQILSEVDLNKYDVPLILGKDMQGNSAILDLTNCPHVLIGGTTGSGKSVLLKTIIHSMLAKYDHAESGLELVLVDPKGSELVEFKNLPQTIAYSTTYKDTLYRLQQAVDYMEDRYKLMSYYGVSDLKQLRQLPRGKKDQPDPYIVFVIDELADLLLQDQKKILATTLTRLIQKSRAAGIHVIAATQNPKRELISGLIKANMPVTIALKTSSAIESRVILDQEGAERLIGKGDMLVNYNGKLTRVQGAMSRRMTFSKKSAMGNIVDFYEGYNQCHQK